MLKDLLSIIPKLTQKNIETLTTFAGELYQAQLKETSEKTSVYSGVLKGLLNTLAHADLYCDEIDSLVSTIQFYHEKRIFEQKAKSIPGYIKHTQLDWGKCTVVHGDGDHVWTSSLVIMPDNKTVMMISPAEYHLSKLKPNTKGREAL